MSKRMGKPKETTKTRHKLSKLDIGSPTIFDSASIASGVIPIRVRSKTETNSRLSEKDRASSLSTFSIDSDAVSISSDSGISSSSSTIDDSAMLAKMSSGRTVSVAESYLQSKSVSNKKSPIQEKLKKVSIPEVPKDLVALKKKTPQIKNKPKQIQKEAKQTVSLDDQIKALQNRQSDLQQELTKLSQQGRSFIFIKSKEHRTKERELNFQLKEVTKTRWKVELDRKFRNDKHLGILDFVHNSSNKYLKGICDIVQEHSRQYGHYTCNNRDDFLNSRPFVYYSLQEILERANPTYEDKQVLLRYDTYQVETLLQSDKIKGKEDKKALKEIYKDLKNEMSESKKNFNSKNDQYIYRLRKSRDMLPDSIMKSVQTVQQLQQILRS